jgi:hypothetical protein
LDKINIVRQNRPFLTHALPCSAKRLRCISRHLSSCVFRKLPNNLHCLLHHWRSARRGAGMARLRAPSLAMAIWSTGRNPHPWSALEPVAPAPDDPDPRIQWIWDWLHWDTDSLPGVSDRDSGSDSHHHLGLQQCPWQPASNDVTARISQYRGEHHPEACSNASSEVLSAANRNTLLGRISTAYHRFDTRTPELSALSSRGRSTRSLPNRTETRLNTLAFC